MIAKRKKRGISTFIATLLLMVLAVSAGVVIYAYVMGYLGGFGGTETLGSMSLDTASVTPAGSVTAYLRNTGKIALTVDKVYVDGSVVLSTPTTDPSPIVESGVGILTFTITSFKPGTTYTIKVVCKDNTQLSFNIKG
jgi:Rieske Fe-S protein